MTLGKMTDADKVMNPKDFGRDPANIQIRINPEIHVWILDQFWLRLDALVEFCTLWASHWSPLLNRFRTEQGHCGACRRKWRLTDTDLCPCCETQTMSHIVESCPLTKLNGGLSRLHSADEDAVSWLTNYGKWHAYEKKIGHQVSLSLGRIELHCFYCYCYDTADCAHVLHCIETTVQRFELDLDGAQTLRVLCYSQQNSLDSLIGKGAVEVNVIMMMMMMMESFRRTSSL